MRLKRILHLSTRSVKFLSPGFMAPPMGRGTIKGREGFSQEEMGFFEALAEMGALAMENARMCEQLRKDYENLMSDILMFVGYRRSF